MVLLQNSLVLLLRRLLQLLLRGHHLTYRQASLFGLVVRRAPSILRELLSLEGPRHLVQLRVTQLLVDLKVINLEHIPLVPLKNRLELLDSSPH